MDVVITDHAADRFCFRIDRTKTNHEAIAILTAAMPTATFLPKRSIRGDELYQIDEPPCLLVCKRENDEIIVVTVIGRDERPSSEVCALAESFKVKHLSMATNVTIQAANSKKAPKDETELYKYIDDKIRYELDTRMYAFIAAQERQDAVYAAHAVATTERSAAAMENQRKNAESARLKDERQRSADRERVDRYDAMVRDLIPTLQIFSKTHHEVGAILLRCFEHVPALVGLLKRANAADVSVDDLKSANERVG